MGCSPTCLLDDGPSGTTTHRVIFPLGLSSMPALPVLHARPPSLGLRGFTPREQWSAFDLRLSLPASRTPAPIGATHISESSELFETLPRVRQERLSARFGGVG